MRRILTVLTALALSVIITFGQSQQSGDCDNDLSGDLVGGYPEVVAPAGTTYVIYEDFDTSSIKLWTAVGGVDLIQKPGGATTDSVLEVTVAIGGDIIYQSIDDADEFYASWNFTLNSGHSDWDNNEYTRGSGFLNSTTSARNLFVGVKDDSETKRWYIQYQGDATSYATEIGTVSLDTEYLVEVYLKRSSGSDDGQIFVWVDGDSLYAVSNIDNNEIETGRITMGNQYAGELDAVLIIDNVKVWEPSGLP